MNIIIREMKASDIPAIVGMEHEAWHEYYSQYEFYDVIKSSVTQQSIADDWSEFISNESQTSGPLITAGDRYAYVALLDGQPIGVGACCAYKENTWIPIDDILRQENGNIRKAAKFQNLYIHPKHRGKGVGHHLAIVRADKMLDLGYEALFMTTYADATRTNQYHLKCGMKHIYDYESLQSYKSGEKAMISCFLHEDLRGYRDDFAAYLEKRIAEEKAYGLAIVD